MKKVLSMLLVFVLLLSLCACGSAQQETSGTAETEETVETETTAEADEEIAGTEGEESASSSEGYKIGMTVADLSNPIWAEVCSAVQDRMKEEYNSEAEVVACDNDATKQVSQVENFITQGVDAIIIQASDAASVTDVCQKAMDAGIMVMCYGVKTEVYDVSLTNDNAGAGKLIGEMAGNYIKENYDGKAEVGLINYYENAECMLRGTEMVDALHTICPDAEVVQECSTVVADEAMTYVENWLQSNPDMKVIMSIGDGGGIGANQAVKAAGKADGFGIFAIDGTIEALQLMANGDPITGEISFGAGWQLGNQVADVCIMALTEDDYEVDNVTPNVVVEKDNLVDLIAEWGYEDQIDLSQMEQ